MLSVIIPHRVEQYLNKTITDVLNKAKGEIEVIVVADGVWPKPIDDKRIIYIHHGTVHNSPGMREGINKAVALASGEYIMKIDEHCMVSEGFDLELINSSEGQHLVIPRRKRLDAEKWELIEDGRPDVDYMYIEYPFLVKSTTNPEYFDSTQGLHGNKWDQRTLERKDIMIDEVMTGQGSCYFMPRKLWDEVIKELDTEHYGPFTMECQEIMNKVWLSGYKCLVNKNCWYAHYHKGKNGKGYGFSNKQYEVFMADKEKGRQYAIDYWLTTKDFKYDFEWLVDKFSPLPGWPEDWKTRINEDKLKDFRYSPEFETWKAH
jgi:glycosyltransferase involved in cell wall biosynthesis